MFLRAGSNRRRSGAAAQKARDVRARLLILGAVMAVAVAAGVASEIQRTAAERGMAEDRTSAGLIRSMVDQESGFRGFVMTGEEVFLRPWETGRRDFDRHVAEARRQSDSESEERELVATVEATARQWQADAARTIKRVRRHGPQAVPVAETEQRRAKMESFRQHAGRLADLKEGDRERTLRNAGFISMVVAALVGLILGCIGYLVIGRGLRAEDARRRVEDEYRASQDEFAEALQVTRAEEEAHDLLKRHLERSMDASIAVMTRNNSENRLTAATDLDAGSPLAGRLEEATPDSCAAIKLGRSHKADVGADPLLRCELCAGIGNGVACVPSLVGGEVIGSVLAYDDGEIPEKDRRRLTESVAQAAPVLGNLRNLAVAETRAATDSLTGLSNRRSAGETLKRMAAQAGRTMSPLSAIAFDLDHFKEINDRFGHGKGDEVLASVGDRATATVRASDFVARPGGEEFIVLLPDTDRDGAVVVAEKLRAAISEVEVEGVERKISASFGVATMPADAGDPEELLRAADRALYAAKAGGRDRVETVASSPAESQATPTGVANGGAQR